MGKVDTYYPLDISLWIPLDILEANCDLRVEREAELHQAEAADKYLLLNKDRVSDDSRCLRLLLNCLWLWKAESWLLRGLRQPIPAADTDRSQIMDVLMGLSHASGEGLSTKFRYLIAVIGWLTGDEGSAIGQFRQIASDTEYIEAKRVLPQDVITDPERKPLVLSGVVERQIGER